MIKLQRGEKPEYLTEEKVKELTELFKVDKSKTVWKHSDIHAALLRSSSSKCAFCESELQVSASYMEIEHFKLKDDFPDEVVSWGNLLPSCKRCNTTKGTHDVVSEPIINPFDIVPREHLTQQGCRIYSKTELGESTREVLNLNDNKLTRPRFEVWNYVVAELEDIHIDITQKAKLTRHDRNKVAKLLTSCQSDRAFSAFASTALHQSKEYQEIVEILDENGLLDEQLEILHQSSLELVLDKRQ